MALSKHRQAFSTPTTRYPRLYAVLGLGRPFALLSCLSTSASHLLAFTSCTTLMTCFAAMMGKLTPASTQGTNESILLARASSSAAAL